MKKKWFLIGILIGACCGFVISWVVPAIGAPKPVVQTQLSSDLEAIRARSCNRALDAVTRAENCNQAYEAFNDIEEKQYCELAIRTAGVAEVCQKCGDQWPGDEGKLRCKFIK